MRQLNIVVTYPLGDECLRQITSVDPGIKILDASHLSAAEQKGDFSSRDEFGALLAQAEVFYGFRPPRDIIARAPKLKWLQTMLAGVDHHLYADIFKSPVIVTNTSGIHGIQISELVFEMILMFAKQAPLYFRLKQEKKWDRVIPMVLHSKTIGIVGLGSIGREVARLAKAFRMNVVATRRSANKAGRARYVDELLSRKQLPKLLSKSDFVVLAVPSTPETDKIIGEKELRSMKPDAYLINIARGSVVDEDALIRALEENWIAGAGLDVFATEPLPVGSKLWELPNVIYNPHIGGQIEDYNMRATAVFAENLRRYLDGKRLVNVVDREKGY